MKKLAASPFPTVEKFRKYYGRQWKGYQIAAKQTAVAEKKLRQQVLKSFSETERKRPLDGDSALILFGSFARFEMLAGSDFDWALLVDGVVNTQHLGQARKIEDAVRIVAEKAGLKPPGSSGTFGGLVFSHDLVHCIGGIADSNINLTRRMLMLLESRWFNLADTDTSPVWENVVKNILERYFEEDVHFTPQGERKVPRFLLNDLTRYWRTICVDYAAKHQEQDGAKWALRNAKIRFSRKLLYAAGLAFCLSCELNPPRRIQRDLFGLHQDTSARPYIESALKFAQTPPLEYLAAFIEAYVQNGAKRTRIVENIFGAYNEWLILLNNKAARDSLEKLDHSVARNNQHFKKVRKISEKFASGLRELFFNRQTDSDDHIANLSLEYVGF